MDAIEDQLVKYLYKTPKEWIHKGNLLEIEWFYVEKGIKKKAMADTVSRTLRIAESNKRIARRDSGKSCEYRFLPPEYRSSYINYEARKDKKILFKS